MFNKKLKGKKNIFILNDSMFSFFQTVPTLSLTHFYVLFSGKKYRINKDLYLLLNIKVKEKEKKDIPQLILDKYYTQPEIAQLCVLSFTTTVNVSEQDLIVEPSAGSGSFIDPMRSINCKKIFLDISPETRTINKIDFLKWTPPAISGKIHVVGNPPFGRQSSLCHQFIQHSATFANSIGFILPLSFKKSSNFSKIPAKFHLIYEIILPLNSFTINGINRKVPTVFQLWVKKKVDRPLTTQKQVPVNLSFVCKDKANLAITRVGGRTGAMKFSTKYNMQTLSKNTHYFLCVEEKLLRFLKPMDQLKCESISWVLGAKSLSKNELITLLNNWKINKS
jgi:hypothetical protein